MITRTRYGPDGRVRKREVLADSEVAVEVAHLAHVVANESVTITHPDGERAEYRRGPEPEDPEAELYLTADELLREHGIRMGEQPAREEDQVPGPYERIGTAVGILGEIRRTLYGANPAEVFVASREAGQRAVQIQPMLTRLWTELVGIEAALMPAADEEVEVR